MSSVASECETSEADDGMHQVLCRQPQLTAFSGTRAAHVQRTCRMEMHEIVLSHVENLLSCGKSEGIKVQLRVQFIFNFLSLSFYLFNDLL